MRAESASDEDDVLRNMGRLCVGTFFLLGIAMTEPWLQQTNLRNAISSQDYTKRGLQKVLKDSPFEHSLF